MGNMSRKPGNGALRPVKVLEARRTQERGETGFQVVKGLAPCYPEQAEDKVKRTGRGEEQGSSTGRGCLESTQRQIRNSQGPWAVSSGRPCSGCGSNLPTRRQVRPPRAWECQLLIAHSVIPPGNSLMQGYVCWGQGTRPMTG